MVMKLGRGYVLATPPYTQAVTDADTSAAQIQNECSTLEALTSQKISESRDKKGLVPAQEAEDRQQIRLAEDAAYAELESSVRKQYNQRNRGSCCALVARSNHIGCVGCTTVVQRLGWLYVDVEST